MRTLFPIAAMALSAVAFAQSPIITTFVSNNGGSAGGAVYFDLVVNVPITITGIDVNVAGAGTVDVFTCPGGRTGNQTNIAAWTQVATGTVSGALNAITPVTGLTPIPLAVGTYGIAYRANGVGNSYTNGTGTNQTYSTAELTLNAGEASNAAFVAPLFTPRVVNTQITYSIGGGGGTVATNTAYGVGCVRKFTSFYENFTSATAYDLSNTNMSMIPAGGGYLVTPGITTYQTPPGSATALALGDDTEVTVALASAFPALTGSVTSLQVCSNGFISTASNGISFTPAVPTMLGNANTGWYHWHDFNPSIVGSGLVKFHESGNTSYVTWDGVWDYAGTSAANANTLQFQFDRATGNVHLCIGTVSSLGAGFLVGYSPGGPSLDPGATDISARLPASFGTFNVDILPLTLAGTTRPVTGTGWQMTTSNIPAGTPFGANLLGFTQFNPGQSLTPIGMPNCFRYTDGSTSVLFIAPGATSLYTLNIPANPSYIGIDVFAQSVTYSPPATPLGAISSNANLLDRPHIRSGSHPKDVQENLLSLMFA
jgi:hypothetical protein